MTTVHVTCGDCERSSSLTHRAVRVTQLGDSAPVTSFVCLVCNEPQARIYSKQNTDLLLAVGVPLTTTPDPTQAGA